MRRIRMAVMYASVSVILIAISVLIEAALGNRLDTVFGGVLKPVISNKLVATVGGVKLYTRDVAMQQLLFGIEQVSSGQGELTDDEALELLVEQTILSNYADSSGLTYDASALEEKLSAIYTLLETDEGRAFKTEYIERFGCSDKAFDTELRAVVEYGIKAEVLIMTLYYNAAAQGMLSEDLSEDEAKAVLKEKLLPKLRAKTIIEIYNKQAVT